MEAENPFFVTDEVNNSGFNRTMQELPYAEGERLYGHVSGVEQSMAEPLVSERKDDTSDSEEDLVSAFK